MKELRKEIDNIMDDAFTIGDANSAVASAYFLEAIAKMMYKNLFHEDFKRDLDRNSMGHIAEEEEAEDEISKSTDI